VVGGWSGPDDYAVGIGGAICRHLTRAGVRVAVPDIEDADAERTLAPIVKEGGDAFTIVADTADEADCQRAVDEVVARYGQLDILVNNVGAGTAPGSLAEFDRLLAVNFRGEVLMAGHAVPHMPRGGAIVNVGSVFGAIDPIPGGYAICRPTDGISPLPGKAFLQSKLRPGQEISPPPDRPLLGQRAVRRAAGDVPARLRAGVSAIFRGRRRPCRTGRR